MRRKPMPSKKTPPPPSANLSEEVKQLGQELVNVRREIHQHPEPGFKEIRTSMLVAERLTRLSLEVKTGVAETGVLGVLRGGKPGKTLLIRADMDCLPLDEETGRPFASTSKGFMHACG